MDKKNITMNIDNENGIKFISLSNSVIKKTISISDDGNDFLNEIGADIVIDFDEQGKVVNIELIGL